MPAVSSVAGKTSSLSSVRKRTYPIISGGTLTSDATYYYRTFTSNGTFSFINSTLSIDYFMIAGGGGGGQGNFFQYIGSDGFYDLYCTQLSTGGGGAAGSRELSSFSNLLAVPYRSCDWRWGD